MSSACRSLKLEALRSARPSGSSASRMMRITLSMLQQHELPAFEDVDAVDRPCRGDAACGARPSRGGTRSTRASIWRRLFWRGRPSRPSITRLIGRLDFEAGVREQQVDELLLRRCRLDLRLEHQAHRRVLVRFVAHRVEHARASAASGCTCSGVQRLLAGLGLRVGELLDLLQHLLRADAPGGSSVTTSCHWPRARSSIFQRARTRSDAAAGLVDARGCPSRCEMIWPPPGKSGPGMQREQLVVAS